MECSAETEIKNMSDTDDSDYDEFEETCIESDFLPCLDLFSNKTFLSAEECFCYCATMHGFNIELFQKRHKMDCFSYIRLINYIRQERPSAAFLMSLASNSIWQEEKYLLPVIQNDPMLMFDIESIDVSSKDAGPSNFAAGEHSRLPAVSGDGCDQNSYQNYIENQILLSKLVEKDKKIECLIEDLNKMKLFAQSILNKEDDENVARGDFRDDISYFSSYSHFSIHHEMLCDRVRTESYRNAICGNGGQLSDKVVLDVGCGTSILSMFCVRAGARHVVGVDQSDIIYNSMEIIRENNMEEKITLVKGQLETVELPYEKFDVIVSEWMGYFLLFEGMLDTIIQARNKYLKVGGLMLPNRCTMYLLPVSDKERHDEVVQFWNNVYDFKMTCMTKEILKESSIEIVPSSAVVSKPIPIKNLDLLNCKVEDLNFVTDFSFEVDRDCKLTSFAGYFDTHFDLDSPVMFSTSPHSEKTHWKQTIFYLPNLVPAKKGQIFNGNIEVSKIKSDPRSLIVRLLFNNSSYVFTIS